MKLALPRNLTTRLVISHLLVGAVSIGLLTVVAFSFIIEGGRQGMRKDLTDLALNLSNRLESPLLSSLANQAVVLEIRQIMETSQISERGIRHQVIASDNSIIDGSLFSPSAALISRYEPLLLSTLRGEMNSFSGWDPQQGELFITLVPISHLEVVYGALALSIPYEPNLEDTRRSLVLMLIISWLVLLAVGLGAYLVARSLNRPLRKLTALAERMKRGDLDARAELTGPEEIVKLSVTLNQLAAQLKDNQDGMRDFVANASHELRTPLTAMKLNTNALLTGALDDPAVSRRFLSQLEDEIDLMSRTVNDLLDLSRIEANRSNLVLELVDLSALVVETADFFQNRARAANLELAAITPDSPSIIPGNDDQLRRLLANLLDNAIKNTGPGGRIDIKVIQTGENHLRLEVADTGIGIAAEYLPHIFERFYRIEGTSKRSLSSGTGLGLAIAKSIAEAQHARIGVNSIVGMGTTFWVEFQVADRQRLVNK